MVDLAVVRPFQQLDPQIFENFKRNFSRNFSRNLIGFGFRFADRISPMNCSHPKTSSFQWASHYEVLIMKFIVKFPENSLEITVACWGCWNRVNFGFERVTARVASGSSQRLLTKQDFVMMHNSGEQKRWAIPVDSSCGRAVVMDNVQWTLAMSNQNFSMTWNLSGKGQYHRPSKTGNAPVELVIVSATY